MRITFTLNGRPRVLDADPFDRANRVLAGELGLESVKASCGVGRCGACMVLIDGTAQNSCLVVAARLEGRDVTTAEGLGARADAVVAALKRHGAVQCGYCAPGLLVTLVAAVERGETLDLAEIEALLAGNLCRCSGYVGVRRAALELLAAC